MQLKPDVEAIFEFVGCRKDNLYLKQAPGSELSAQSPTRGSNSRTARS